MSAQHVSAPSSPFVAVIGDGIIIREFKDCDLGQCKYLLEHTQAAYGNPAVYVKMTFETDMKDVTRNYVELTDADLVLPTSVPSASSSSSPSSSPTGGRRRGTWLVAVDTVNKTPQGFDTVCGQVAIHPLLIGDGNVYKYYAAKLAEEQQKKKEAEEGIGNNSSSYTPPYPYNLNIQPEDVAELRRMAVLPSYQAKRIGYSLLAAFADFAKNILHYKIIHLTTLVSMDKAVAFYTRQRFVCERLEFLRMGMVEAATATEAFGKSSNGAKQGGGGSSSSNNGSATTAEGSSKGDDAEGEGTTTTANEEKPPMRYLPGVVERREIHGTLDSLSPEEMAQAVVSPATSNTLYVVHFWREL